MGEFKIGYEQFPDIGGRKFNVEIEEFEHQLLKQFRTALKNVENLKCPMNDTFLIRFLRNKNYNVEAAVKVVDKYFYFRLQNVELMSIPYNTRGEVYDTKMALVFKHRDEKGRQIICFSVNKWNPQVLTFDEIGTALYLVLEEVTSLTETQKKGIILILDATDLTVSHAKAVVKECSLRQLKKLITVFQGAFPAKIKGIFGATLAYSLHSLIISWHAITMEQFNYQNVLLKIRLSSSGPEALNGHLNESIRPTFLGGNLTYEEAEDISFFEAIMENKTYYKALQNFGYPS